MKNKILGMAVAVSIVISANAAIARVDMGSEGVGGGNSLDSQMIENYVRPIKSISGYADYLAPLLKNLDGKIPGLASSINEQSQSLHWYLIPTSLKALTKKHTGLPFNSDQIAVQANGEVFIDMNLFAQMNTSQRGLLLLHEIIESFYGSGEENMPTVRAVVNILAQTPNLNAQELQTRLQDYRKIWTDYRTSDQIDRGALVKKKLDIQYNQIRKDYLTMVYAAVSGFCVKAGSPSNPWGIFNRRKTAAAADYYTDNFPRFYYYTSNPKRSWVALFDRLQQIDDAGVKAYLFSEFDNDPNTYRARFKVWYKSLDVFSVPETLVYAYGPDGREYQTEYVSQIFQFCQNIPLFQSVMNQSLNDKITAPKYQGYVDWENIIPKKDK